MCGERTARRVQTTDRRRQARAVEADEPDSSADAGGGVSVTADTGGAVSRVGGVVAIIGRVGAP
jgi:hypothetical protein